MGKAFNLTLLTLVFLAAAFYVFQNYDPGFECREEFVRIGSVTGSVLDKDTATARLNEYIDENFNFEYEVKNPDYEEIKFCEQGLGLRFNTTAYVAYKFAVDNSGNVYVFRSCPE